MIWGSQIIIILVIMSYLQAELLITLS